MTLEQLAWSGACDALLVSRDGVLAAGGAQPPGADRRTALWQMGIAAPSLELDLEPRAPRERRAVKAQRPPARQLALPLELPATPALRRLGRWQRLIADYSTSGVTIGEHAMAILRERITAPKLVTSAQLARLPSGCDVSVAGLVIARQRPGTANGTMFLLFEDEYGTVNLIVPREVYERRRHLARAEPLLLAHGRLERHQEGAARQAGLRDALAPVREPDGEEIRPVINLLVAELDPLERYIDGALPGEQGEAGVVRRLPGRPEHQDGSAEQADGAEVGSSMRAVAPPIQSFASGRRR